MNLRMKSDIQTVVIVVYEGALSTKLLKFVLNSFQCTYLSPSAIFTAQNKPQVTQTVQTCSIVNTHYTT